MVRATTQVLAVSAKIQLELFNNEIQKNSKNFLLGNKQKNL